MKRIKPAVIPAINPVPEYLVEGRRKELYEDTKHGLQVPWMGVVTMALADFEAFYEELWRACGPIMQSEEAVKACARLREEIETEIEKLNPAKLNHPLEKMGYSPWEIGNIRQVIEVFSHGNFLYCMMATLSRLALELDQFPPAKLATVYTKRHAPLVDVPFILIEEHHADDQTKETYASIRKALALPFVNTDYRGLSRWPSYFRNAWADLERVVATPEYEATVENVHNRFVEEAMKLPNPTGATADDIKKAAERSVSLERVLEVNQLFQWLLPGLITNVAFLRAQLR